jgi:hypothetical protein
VIFIETISFTDAFKYPYKVPVRILYVLLLIIPIIGWLILFGYIVRLVNEFIDGNYEGLIGLELVEDLKLGLLMFLKALPFYIIYAVIMSAAMYISEALGTLIQLLAIFILPLLVVNFCRKQTVGSFFEFDIFNIARDNLGEYIAAVIKQLILSIIFVLLSFILIGIPGLYFTSSIFVANFYGRYIAQNHSLALKIQSDKPLTV